MEGHILFVLLVSSVAWSTGFHYYEPALNFIEGDHNSFVCPWYRNLARHAPMADGSCEAPTATTTAAPAANGKSTTAFKNCLSDQDCAPESFCCLAICQGITRCYNPTLNEFTDELSNRTQKCQPVPACAAPATIPTTPTTTPTTSTTPEPEETVPTTTPTTTTTEPSTTTTTTTTEEPTTTTTEAPTTTEEPSTEAPTTTEEPSTEAPTTTEEPSTEAPTTTTEEEEPSTEPPTTEPTTQEPKTTTASATTEPTTSSTTPQSGIPQGRSMSRPLPRQVDVPTFPPFDWSDFAQLQQRFQQQQQQPDLVAISEARPNSAATYVGPRNNIPPVFDAQFPGWGLENMQAVSAVEPPPLSSPTTLTRRRRTRKRTKTTTAPPGSDSDFMAVMSGADSQSAAGYVGPVHIEEVSSPGDLQIYRTNSEDNVRSAFAPESAAQMSSSLAAQDSTLASKKPATMTTTETTSGTAGGMGMAGRSMKFRQSAQDQEKESTPQAKDTNVSTTETPKSTPEQSGPAEVATTRSDDSNDSLTSMAGDSNSGFSRSASISAASSNSASGTSFSTFQQSQSGSAALEEEIGGPLTNKDISSTNSAAASKAENDAMKKLQEFASSSAWNSEGMTGASSSQSSRNQKKASLSKSMRAGFDSNEDFFAELSTRPKMDLKMDDDAFEKFRQQNFGGTGANFFASTSGFEPFGQTSSRRGNKKAIDVSQKIKPFGSY